MGIAALNPSYAYSAFSACECFSQVQPRRIGTQSQKTDKKRHQTGVMCQPAGRRGQLAPAKQRGLTMACNLLVSARTPCVCPSDRLRCDGAGEAGGQKAAATAAPTSSIRVAAPGQRSNL